MYTYGNLTKKDSSRYARNCFDKQDQNTISTCTPDDLYQFSNGIVGSGLDSSQ
ncbi:MAG: hypothetical protein PXX83_01095 [Candidatus Nitrosotalea sp.]|nr:hypothetical protein [Candidatus Nitrosotalea sp.]